MVSKRQINYLKPVIVQSKGIIIWVYFIAEEKVEMDFTHFISSWSKQDSSLFVTSNNNRWDYWGYMNVQLMNHVANNFVNWSWEVWKINFNWFEVDWN